MMKRIKIIFYKPKFTAVLWNLFLFLFIIFGSIFMFIDVILHIDENASKDFGRTDSYLPQPISAIIYYIVLLVSLLAHDFYIKNKDEIEREIEMLEQGVNKRFE